MSAAAREYELALPSFGLRAPVGVSGGRAREWTSGTARFRPSTYARRRLFRRPRDTSELRPDTSSERITMGGLGPARIGTLYTKDQCRLATWEIRHLGVQWDKRKRFLPFWPASCFGRSSSAGAFFLFCLQEYNAKDSCMVFEKSGSLFYPSFLCFKLILELAYFSCWNEKDQANCTKQTLFFYTVETVHHSEIRCLVITYLLFFFNEQPRGHAKCLLTPS
jgi:hypothetical protein